eukprot:265847-Chlamydomonas_euryale.AAC.3
MPSGSMAASPFARPQRLGNLFPCSLHHSIPRLPTPSQGEGGGGSVRHPTLTGCWELMRVGALRLWPSLSWEGPTPASPNLAPPDWRLFSNAAFPEAPTSWRQPRGGRATLALERPINSNLNGARHVG